MSSVSAPADSSRLLAGIGLSAMIATALPIFMVSSLGVEIRTDLGISNSLLGISIAVSYAVAMGLSAVAGQIVDKVGAAMGIRVGSALALLCSLLVAAIANSAIILIVALTLAGLANAISSPGGSALISQMVTPRRQGLLIGIQHAGAPASALLGGLALTFIALPFGWRWGFVAASVAALLVLLMMRSLPPIDAKPPPQAEQRRSGLRPVHMLSIGAAMANVAANGMVAFLIIYAVEEGVSKGAAGIMLVAATVVACAARVIAGAIVDARDNNALRVAATTLAIGALGYPLLATEIPAAIVAGAILAGGIGWSWSGLITLATVRANRDQPGTAVGILMVGIYGGAGIGPAMIGIISEHASFTAAWLVAACFALLAALAVETANRMGARRAAAAVALADAPD